MGTLPPNPNSDQDHEQPASQSIVVEGVLEVLDPGGGDAGQDGVLEFGEGITRGPRDRYQGTSVPE